MTTQSEFIRNKIDEFLCAYDLHECGPVVAVGEFEQDLRNHLDTISLIKSYDIAQLCIGPDKFVMSICWIAWDNDMDTAIFQYYDWRD